MPFLTVILVHQASVFFNCVCERFFSDHLQDFLLPPYAITFKVFPMYVNSTSLISFCTTWDPKAVKDFQICNVAHPYSYCRVIKNIRGLIFMPTLVWIEASAQILSINILKLRDFDKLKLDLEMTPVHLVTNFRCRPTGFWRLAHFRRIFFWSRASSSRKRTRSIERNTLFVGSGDPPFNWCFSWNWLSTLKLTS